MISDFCIRRPIFASVLSIVVTLAGLAALVGLPVEQYPPIAPPTVTVSASFPGADAATVAQAVAAPIETQVNGVDNMLYMSSTSSSTGQMSLTVYFKIGTDPDTAQVQVQNRVNIALPQLPDIVRNTGVRVEKRSSSIMMLLAVYAPDGRYDVDYVANYANLYVLDAVKRVPGANQASLFGASDNAMRIWLRPDRMASRSITTTDIQTAIAKQNQQFGAGAIGQSPTTQPVEVTIPVVTEGRFNRPEQFENVILRTDPEGAAIVRLADVGRAEEGLQNYMLRPNLNGKPAVFISVYQQPGSNALEVAQGVRKTLEDLKAALVAERLRELPGLGKTSEEKIARAIERLGLHGKDRRTPIVDVLPLARSLTDELSGLDGVTAAQYCGSLRRFSDTIGDVDIVVATTAPAPVMDHVAGHRLATEFVGHGDTKTSILTRSGLQVDVRAVSRRRP